MWNSGPRMSSGKGYLLTGMVEANYHPLLDNLKDVPGAVLRPIPVSGRGYRVRDNPPRPLHRRPEVEP